MQLSSSPRGAATDERERVLERQIGARSSNPSFYAAWREKSARLDRTIETLERISADLCVTPDGPGALCQALVDAVGPQEPQLDPALASPHGRLRAAGARG